MDREKSQEKKKWINYRYEGLNHFLSIQVCMPQYRRTIEFRFYEQQTGQADGGVRLFWGGSSFLIHGVLIFARDSIGIAACH